MLGFILCAMFYKTKEIKPFRFILALGILCSASAYGIILSAGIAIAWLIEIFYKDFSINSVKKFFCDERFFALLILLMFNLMLVISITPKPDTYAMANVVKNNDYISRFIYMFFVLPGDATYLDICNYFTTKLAVNIDSSIGIAGSGIISFLLIAFAKRNNKLLLLLIPYSFIGVFSTFVYFNPHHVGIITEFFLFIVWICYEGKKEKNINFQFLNKLIREESDIRLLNGIPAAFFGIVICISIIWTIMSSVNDIYFPYGVGRDLETFIKENNLDKYNIMAQWKQYTNNETKKTVVDTNLIGGTDALPYFDKNIYYNLNDNIPNKCFVTHMVANNDENIKEWKEIGFPDVIIGSPDLRIVFGNSLSYKDYVCVYDSKGNYIWKWGVTDYEYLVYIRKDIMDQFPNLKEIEP